MPEILRDIKYASVGSLVAFQLSNVFHIFLGKKAFNNPEIKIKVKTIVGNIKAPLGVDIIN